MRKKDFSGLILAGFFIFDFYLAYAIIEDLIRTHLNIARNDLIWNMPNLLVIIITVVSVLLSFDAIEHQKGNLYYRFELIFLLLPIYLWLLLSKYFVPDPEIIGLEPAFKLAMELRTASFLTTIICILISAIILIIEKVKRRCKNTKTLKK